MVSLEGIVMECIVSSNEQRNAHFMLFRCSVNAWMTKWLKCGKWQPCKFLAMHFLRFLPGHSTQISTGIMLLLYFFSSPRLFYSPILLLFDHFPTFVAHVVFIEHSLEFYDYPRGVAF